MKTLSDLQTPALLLDYGKMRANIGRMRQNLGGAPLRLHCKTCKSVDAALLCQGDKNAPIAVSTLAEAEYFAKAGFTDILYAVGMAPARLERVMALEKDGVSVKIITDNVDTARAIASYAGKHAFTALLEIDCDGHRGGVDPASRKLIEMASILAHGGQNLAGVLTHAGSAYELPKPDAAAFRALANQENNAVRSAAAKLREAGFPCPITSVGSTPTALFGGNFDGISEVRAGVFLFQDCVQAALGVCDPSDIALSVLCSVIGARQKDGAIIMDAGWTALSQDQGVDFAKYGYGLVADEQGRILPGVKVCELNQEHGIIKTCGGAPPLRPGGLLRILPVHACAAANAFDQYQIIENGKIKSAWPKCRGW